MRLLAKGPLRLLLLRKKSPKGRLLRNALHQRGRPTQRKSPERLLKRNEYKRATSWLCYWPLADISLTSINVRFRRKVDMFDEKTDIRLAPITDIVVSSRQIRKKERHVMRVNAKRYAGMLASAPWARVPR
jgi:hypothetical protein